MVELILPYFNQLKDGKTIALSQWQKVREILIIKQNYGDIIKEFVDIISQETFSIPFGELRLIGR